MRFKVFPNFDKVKTETNAGIEVIVKGQGEERFLLFNKPVRMIEINKSEALKIALALLGRIAICEICGTPYRRKGSTGHHAKTRFCSRECFFEWCHRTGGTFGKYSLVETDDGTFKSYLREPSKPRRRTFTEEECSRGGKQTQKLHPEVRRNLKQFQKKRR